jgi:hypothetical protein
VQSKKNIKAVMMPILPYKFHSMHFPLKDFHGENNDLPNYFSNIKAVMKPILQYKFHLMYCPLKDFHGEKLLQCLTGFI